MPSSIDGNVFVCDQFVIAVFWYINNKIYNVIEDYLLNRICDYFMQQNIK